MKEAIANAGVFNLITIFMVILIAFFVGSLSYSKAFKVKNKIVEEIEKEEGYTTVAASNIDEWLGNLGYRINAHNGTFSCPTVESFDEQVSAINDNSGNYQYCVYQLSTCNRTAADRCGTYYKVIAYMYFDFPIIGDFLAVPVSGETKTFINLNS